MDESSFFFRRTFNESFPHRDVHMYDYRDPYKLPYFSQSFVDHPIIPRDTLVDPYCLFYVFSTGSRPLSMSPLSR